MVTVVQPPPSSASQLHSGGLSKARHERVLQRFLHDHPRNSLRHSNSPWHLYAHVVQVDHQGVERQDPCMAFLEAQLERFQWFFGSCNGRNNCALNSSFYVLISQKKPCESGCSSSSNAIGQGSFKIKNKQLS